MVIVGEVWFKQEILHNVFNYFSTTKSLHNTSESADALISTLRAITLRVASIVTDRSAELFCSLRNEMTTEDLRRNANALQQSHAINTLIPFTLANLEGLDDAKVKISWQVYFVFCIFLPVINIQNFIKLHGLIFSYWVHKSLKKKCKTLNRLTLIMSFLSAVGDLTLQAGLWIQSKMSD